MPVNSYFVAEIGEGLLLTLLPTLRDILHLVSTLHFRKNQTYIKGEIKKLARKSNTIIFTFLS